MIPDMLMYVPRTSTQSRERAIRSPRPSNSANFALLTGIVTAPVVLLAHPSPDIERPAAILRVTLMWTRSDGFGPESDACSPSARQVLSVTLFRRGFLGLFLIDRGSIYHIDPSSSES